MNNIDHWALLSAVLFAIILAHMIRHPTQAFGRAEILDACLPESDALVRTVDTHISNLRRKLEDLGQTGFFTAVRGVGYRFSDPQ